MSRAWPDKETARAARSGARVRPGPDGGLWAGRGTRFVGAVDAPAVA